MRSLVNNWKLLEDGQGQTALVGDRLELELQPLGGQQQVKLFRTSDSFAHLKVTC